MRTRKHEDMSFKLESGGIVHVKASFNMTRLTANDRVVMCAIADAVQRAVQRDRERWFPPTPPEVTFATTTVDGNATAAPGMPHYGYGCSTIASGVGTVFDPSDSQPAAASDDGAAREPQEESEPMTDRELEDIKLDAYGRGFSQARGCDTSQAKRLIAEIERLRVDVPTPAAQEPKADDLYHSLVTALGWQHLAGPTQVLKRAAELGVLRSSPAQKEKQK